MRLPSRARMWMPTLLVVLAALPASAGTLRGTVHGAPSAPAAGRFNAYPGQAGSMPGCRMPVHGLPSDAVVYLERIPAAAESLLAAHAQPRPKLAQKDQCFQPRVVAIAVGGSVDFPNLDPIYHNVFSVSPIKRFDLGKYPRGQSKAVVFGKAGLVNVYCDIHSDMAAFVLVAPNHAYTMPDADGDFEFPDLPAGRYTVHIWHPDFPEQVREVELPAAGARELEVRW